MEDKATSLMQGLFGNRAPEPRSEPRQDALDNTHIGLDNAIGVIRRAGFGVATRVGPKSDPVPQPTDNLLAGKLFAELKEKEKQAEDEKKKRLNAEARSQQDSGKEDTQNHFNALQIQMERNRQESDRRFQSMMNLIGSKLLNSGGPRSPGRFDPYASPSSHGRLEEVASPKKPRSFTTMSFTAMPIQEKPVLPVKKLVKIPEVDIAKTQMTEATHNDFYSWAGITDESLRVAWFYKEEETAISVLTWAEKMANAHDKTVLQNMLTHVLGDYDIQKSECPTTKKTIMIALAKIMLHLSVADAVLEEVS